MARKKKTRKKKKHVTYAPDVKRQWFILNTVGILFFLLACVLVPVAHWFASAPPSWVYQYYVEYDFLDLTVKWLAFVADIILIGAVLSMVVWPYKPLNESLIKHLRLQRLITFAIAGVTLLCALAYRFYMPEQLGIFSEGKYLMFSRLPAGWSFSSWMIVFYAYYAALLILLLCFARHVWLSGLLVKHKLLTLIARICAASLTLTAAFMGTYAYFRMHYFSSVDYFSWGRIRSISGTYDRGVTVLVNPEHETFQKIAWIGSTFSMIALFLVGALFLLLVALFAVQLFGFWRHYDTLHQQDALREMDKEKPSPKAIEEVENLA